MSASESMATPTLPTSPSARGGRSRSPSGSGGRRRTDRPVWPGIEEELEALVGRLGGAEAGVLAHGPELPRYMPAWIPRVYGKADPGSPSCVGRIPALEVFRPVDGPDLDPRVGRPDVRIGSGDLLVAVPRLPG
jgi:hypothetical protein